MVTTGCSLKTMLLKAMPRMHQNATLSEYDSNAAVYVEKLFLLGFMYLKSVVRQMSDWS